MVTRAIENAQKRVEAHHFEMRKHLLEYDDVMNKQREVIYSMRQEILEATDGLDQIKEMASTILDSVIDLHLPETEHFDDWDIETFAGAVESQYGIPATIEGQKNNFFGFRTNGDRYRRRTKRRACPEGSSSHTECYR